MVLGLYLQPLIIQPRPDLVPRPSLRVGTRGRTRRQFVPTSSLCGTRSLSLPFFTALTSKNASLYVFPRSGRGWDEVPFIKFGSRPAKGKTWISDI